nr:hypothetical protein [Mesotoga sp. H07pep.5.4]
MKLNRALASTKLCQPVGKMRNGFVTGIEPDVVLNGREADYVALFPVSGNFPRDSIHGVRERRAERIPHLMKEWTNAFGLGFNIGVNRFKGLAARMLLILFLKFTTTFWALPHRNSLLPFPYREFNAVTGLLSDSRPNILPYADNVANGTLGILRAHFARLPSRGSPSKVA